MHKITVYFGIFVIFVVEAVCHYVTAVLKIKIMRYYINFNGQQVGPMTEEQLLAYPVNINTPVCSEGGQWLPLSSYPELMQLLQARNHPGSIDSKRVLCGILAILLGSLGVQYFVIGKVGAGLLTILLTIVTCGLWSVLTLVQGIMMLTMSDAEFERKYVLSNATLPLF